MKKRKSLEAYIIFGENILAGLVLAGFGILSLKGGRFGIQVTPESPERWSAIPELGWVAWVIIWLGVDYMLFCGKATSFLLERLLERPLGFLISRVRDEKLGMGKEGKGE